MTLILNESDWDELHEYTPLTRTDHLMGDEFEELTGMPIHLGRGYSRAMDLLPGVWLCLSESEFDQDVILKAPVHDHPIQISIFPEGMLYFDAVHPNLGGGRSYFSGSGISPAVAGLQRAGERLTCIDIEIDPELFYTGFLSDPQREDESLKPLFRGEDWKVAVYPMVTPAMRAIAHAMWHPPYRGGLKRIYLQGKVLELLAMYLDLLSQHPPVTSWTPRLKPETIACLHHAKDILDRHLDNPPSIHELAQQICVSDSSLLRGFKQLFGTTVIGYLTQQRLHRAAQLLRQGDTEGLQGKRTVTEVAGMVGYSHLGHFTAMFKRQFGITPSECLAGKKLIL
jgi:AraC-like DNA-binding protein